MHTSEISRVTSDAVSRVSKGDMTPEAAKSISDLCRTEISNWRVQLEYARHTGKVTRIDELEKSQLRQAA